MEILNGLVVILGFVFCVLMLRPIASTFKRKASIEELIPSIQLALEFIFIYVAFDMANVSIQHLTELLAK